MHSNMFHRLSMIIGILLLALIPLLTPAAQAQKASNQQASEPVFVDPMLGSATTNGKQAAVIVTVRTDFKVEATLDNQQDIDTQRAAIKQAQQIVINRVTPLGATLKRIYTTVPMLALQVNATALTALGNAPEVMRVDVDKQNQLQLYESVPHIGATQAHSYGATGAGQTVAILDTGVDKYHPFVSGKIVAEACFSTTYYFSGAYSVCPGGVETSTAAGSGINCLIQGCDHGTHVAGIAAGKTSQLSWGGTFSGVAPAANIIAIQVFSAFYDSGSCYQGCLGAMDSDLIAALEHVYSLRSSFRIASINMSLGGGRYSQSCPEDPLAPMVNQLRAAGIATVISSGNYGFIDSIGSPACIPNAISVGATGSSSDYIADFSNSASFLTFLAPGNNIYSSVPGGGFAIKSGTSMAAPHVAGAWAALRTLAPNASVDQIKNTLLSTGVPIYDSRNGITKPRIQLNNAALALPRNSAANDINGDGRSDILWRHSFDGSNALFFMDGFTIKQAGTFSQVSDVNWRVAGTGDFNGDGRSDILWQNHSSGLVVIYFMNGSQMLSWPSITQISDLNWQIVGTGDFNADKRSDIVWSNQATGQVVIFFMNGSQILSWPQVTQVTDVNWRIVGIGDLNGDGRSDLVWRHNVSGQNYLYLMNGGSVIGYGAINQVPDLNWRIVGVDDFDLDGYEDLLWYNRNLGQAIIYYMRGAQILSWPVIGGVNNVNWDILGGGDFNGDGRGDVLWRNLVSGQNHIFLTNVDSSAISPVSDVGWKIVSGGARNVNGISPNTSTPPTDNGAIPVPIRPYQAGSGIMLVRNTSEYAAPQPRASTAAPMKVQTINLPTIDAPMQTAIVATPSIPHRLFIPLMSR